MILIYIVVAYLGFIDVKTDKIYKIEINETNSDWITNNLV